jgi:hypothetical protein
MLLLLLMMMLMMTVMSYCNESPFPGLLATAAVRCTTFERGFYLHAQHASVHGLHA